MIIASLDPEYFNVHSRQIDWNVDRLNYLNLYIGGCMKKKIVNDNWFLNSYRNK